MTPAPISLLYPSIRDLHEASPAQLDESFGRGGSSSTAGESAGVQVVQAVSDAFIEGGEEMTIGV